MGEMFFGYQLLESFPDISKYNTSNVVNFESMFYKCKNLLTLLIYQNGV